MLADRLLVLLVQTGKLFLHDLAHAHLRQFLGDNLGVEHTALDGRFVLHEGGDQLVEVFAADALRLRALGLGEAIYFELHTARFRIHADVALGGIVTAGAVIEARGRGVVGILGPELEARGQHLLHEQAGGDGLERVVHRLGDGALGGVGLGDEIGEAGAGLARRVAGGAADDLHDFGEAGAITDGQGVLAPDPVEALLGHAEGDDYIDVVAVVLLRRVAEGGLDLVALGRVVVHEVGDFDHGAVGQFHELETRFRIGALPFAELFEDVLDLLDLVPEGFPRIDVGDVDDGLLLRIQDLDDFVGVAVGVEDVADVELLEVLVAVELFVVGVSDGFEFGLVFRVEHGGRVAAKIGAGHRDEVNFVAGHELAHVVAEAVVGVGGDVVKLIHRDEALVEDLDAEFFHREAEGGVGADEGAVAAVQEFLQGLDLAAVLGAGGIAEVPARLDFPVGPETALGERLVVEARADGFFRDDDDGLLELLVVQLFEGDEHERSALARGRGRFDEQVLLAAPLVGALLHGPHAHRVFLGGAAVGGVGDGDGGDGGGLAHV